MYYYIVTCDDFGIGYAPMEFRGGITDYFIFSLQSEYAGMTSACVKMAVL